MRPLHVLAVSSIFVASSLGLGCAVNGTVTAAPPIDDAGIDDGYDAAADGGGAPLGDARAVDAAVSATCVGKSAQPLDATWTVSSKGTGRTARVHVPTSYDPTKRAAVVLNFHGYTSNAAEQELLSQMTPKADKEGFVVVYPEGLSNSWNAGGCCGTSMSSGVDDVAFVSDLLDALGTKLCVDAHRVFATGMSNGGFLSHRLGCDLSMRIAAIAPVAGVLAPAACDAKRAVPVMDFHGTADSVVPYAGNASYSSAADTIAAWAKRNGCAGQPVETFRKGDAHCATYATCVDRATTTLCTIDNGGHTWPGGLPIPALGVTTTNLSATDAMWTFFTEHPLP